jgi:hypothetical protein
MLEISLGRPTSSNTTHIRTQYHINDAERYNIDAALPPSNFKQHRSRLERCMGTVGRRHD